MHEVSRQNLDDCSDAIREVAVRLIDEGHAERDVTNAFLCELLAFRCETPDDVEAYLSGLLCKFRRHRSSIQTIFSQGCCH